MKISFTMEPISMTVSVIVMIFSQVKSDFLYQFKKLIVKVMNVHKISVKELFARMDFVMLDNVNVILVI